ncbi:MAG: hypothetical protein C0622_13020 [Desulfuromonas sp.]|nr:MAG: hypothetical protein C0622_13020 [Desulfuromonas sp.]
MKRYLLTTLIYLFFLGSCILLIYGHCQRSERELLGLRLATERAAIESSINTYRLLAHTINDEVIQQERVLSLVDGIVNNTGEERDILRGRLYRLLSPAYQRMRGKQVRQLHFHFPDNRSMLRFHAHARSDDSLTDVRPSVAAVNRFHRAVHGYESGRVFHGFRNVYPLYHDGQAIGSVEISTSFYEIRQEFSQLDKTNKTHLAFLIYRPEMWDKLFVEIRSLYQPSLLSPDYVIERADMLNSICAENGVTSPLSERIQQKLNESGAVAAELAQRESFARALEVDDRFYALVFHSIKNTAGEHAAYILSVTPEPFLAGIRNDGALMGGFAIILLTLILIYRLRFLAADEKKKEQDLFLASISDNLGTALYATNRHGEITFTNKALEHLLGYSQGVLLGANAHELFHIPDPEIQGDGCFCHRVIEENRTIKSECHCFKNRAGELLPVEIVCSPLISNKQVVGTTTIFQDISVRLEQESNLENAREELKKANQKLQQLASSDGLTEVANRRSFNERIERLWRSAQRQQKPLGLLMVDIDYFKLYNDYYGHQQGDVCLKMIAKALEEACQRPEDFVARYGGGEFAVVLPGTDEQHSRFVAERIQENVAALAIEHPKAAELLKVSVSIGCCSLIPESYHTVADLIRLADESLYRAKKAGRNGICCWHQ